MEREELPHYSVPCLNFIVLFWGGGEGMEEHEHTDVRPSTEDQCTLFTTHLFAYYRANASHEHQQFGYSYYRQKIT